MRSDEELKQIAKDMYSGLIFSNLHLMNEKDHISMVFMPLFLMDEKEVEKLTEKDITLIFEYMDKAGPRTVNGMPTFTTMQLLTRKEYEKMFEYYNQVKEAMESI